MRIFSLYNSAAIYIFAQRIAACATRPNNNKTNGGYNKNTMTQMPKVDIKLLQSKLDPAEFQLAKGILKPDNSVRVSKPNDDGITQYIWRMVVFQVSPLSQHHCMPVSAIYFYLPGKYDSPEYKALQKAGDHIADAIVDCIPMDEWHGIKKWARVL